MGFLKDLGNLPGKIGREVVRDVKKVGGMFGLGGDGNDFGDVKNQLDLYKRQRDALDKQANDLATQKKAETQKLHEKQIRSLRRSYKSSGFLDAQTPDTSTTLG